MKKTMLILLSAVLLGAPVTAFASEQGEAGVSVSNISINVKNKQVRVVGANGMKMEVYNLTGVSISTIQIESNDTSLNLNLPKGCYILKIGKIVRKVSIS